MSMRIEQGDNLLGQLNKGILAIFVLGWNLWTDPDQVRYDHVMTYNIYDRIGGWPRIHGAAVESADEHNMQISDNISLIKTECSNGTTLIIHTVSD